MIVRVHDGRGVGGVCQAEKVPRLVGDHAREVVAAARSRAGRDEVVVGEDDVSSVKVWPIRSLEALHGFGPAVGFKRRFSLEDEEVNEPGRVALFLPRQVHARAGLVGRYKRHEFLDGLFNPLDPVGPNFVLGHGLYGH